MTMTTRRDFLRSAAQAGLAALALSTGLARGRLEIAEDPFERASTVAWHESVILNRQWNAKPGLIRNYRVPTIEGVPTQPMRVVEVTDSEVKARPVHLPPGPESLTYSRADFERWYPPATAYQ